MKQQNYANHRRLDPKYHFIFILLTAIVLVGSIINLISVFNSDASRTEAILIFLISLMFTLIISMIRTYPLKAQDRAIHAEEGLRHFILSGKRIDPRLTNSQIIALRFASDAEYIALCEKAADENLAPDAIKKAISSWRGDHFRI
ncbi:MAG: hypothetical protein JWM44_2136 [Bacilli bacterium]|nr:hypothetical protein [Bacilli bacterium]